MSKLDNVQAEIFLPVVKFYDHILPAECGPGRNVVLLHWGRGPKTGKPSPRI